jgi:hypothetical protein
MAHREYNDYIDANERLSARTKANYRHSYFKMADGLDKPLAKSNQKDIIEYIYGMTENPNSRVQHINVAIQVRRHYDASIDKLVNTRMRLKLKIDEHKDAVNERKKEELPSMAELTRHLQTLYTEERWRDVVVNYLLLTYNTRNKDLDIAIVGSQKHATDPEVNYIIHRKNDSVYVRNNYKTRSVYGVKRHVFRTVKINRAIRSFVEEKGGFPEDGSPVWLLSTGNNKRIEDTSIQKFIRGRTYEGLSEGDYNKVAVTQINKLGNFSKLKRLSANRGTSMSTLITEYHLDFKSSD